VLREPSSRERERERRRRHAINKISSRMNETTETAAATAAPIIIDFRDELGFTVPGSECGMVEPDEVD